MTMRGGQKAEWGLGGESSVCDVCPRRLSPFWPILGEAKYTGLPLDLCGWYWRRPGKWVLVQGGARVHLQVDETAWPPHSLTSLPPCSCPHPLSLPQLNFKPCPPQLQLLLQLNVTHPTFWLRPPDFHGHGPSTFPVSLPAPSLCCSNALTSDSSHSRQNP